MPSDDNKYSAAGFAEAVQILASYGPEELFTYQFQHDQMWFGPDAEKVSAADAERLLALGWFVDEGHWSKFS